MSDPLSEQLAQLGLRPTGNAMPPAGVADQVDDIIASSFPWASTSTDWHPTLVWQARDLHETLEHWLNRLSARLAPHGIKLTRSLDVPLVPKEKYVSNGKEHIIEGKCEHPFVEVHESVATLLCRTCRLPVNPIWWLARRTKDIEKAESWNRHLRDERKKLQEEIDALKAERSKHKQAAKRAKESAAKARGKKP